MPMKRAAAAANDVRPQPTLDELRERVGGRRKSENVALTMRARDWLDRQLLLGLISPEGAQAVERLIEDLR